MDATIPCVCPPRGDAPQHEQDTITFRERLDFRGGVAIRQQLELEKIENPAITAGEILAVMSEFYLVFGITDWTLRDARGKSVPVSKQAVTAFLEEHSDVAMELVDTADNLYREQVLLPLLKRASASSQPSPNPEPTSVTLEKSTTKSASRKRPSRCSTSTTPMDGTGTITSLPGGGSRSSRNSVSAA